MGKTGRHKFKQAIKVNIKNSLAIQWFRLHTSTAGGTVLTPVLSRSRGEKSLRWSGAGNLGVLLKWDWYVGELLGSHQGFQVTFRSSIWNVGLLLRRCSGQGPHVSMTGEPRGFSWVGAGFSSYNREFRLPLQLAQGSPVFIRIVS